MKVGNWSYIQTKLEEENKKIFKNKNILNLSDYEKRKIIYNYLCNNLSYDYDKLIDIYINNLEKNGIDKKQIYLEIKNFLLLNNIYSNFMMDKIKEKINNYNITRERDSYKELESVINNHKGICNGISQYYKLLLEINGIYSVCVICDNMMPVNHQINLVYDKDNDLYSFDDITSYITKAGTLEQCFDYDMDDAKEIKQGLRPVSFLMQGSNIDDVFNSFGIILPTQVINYLVGKSNNNYLKYGLEENNNIKLPDNISSIKKNKSIKR